MIAPQAQSSSGVSQVFTVRRPMVKVVGESRGPDTACDLAASPEVSAESSEVRDVAARGVDRSQRSSLGHQPFDHRAPMGVTGSGLKHRRHDAAQR